MPMRFRVRIGDEECVCETADGAPGVAAMLRRALPLSTFATHAKFAGHELILMVPSGEMPATVALLADAAEYFAANGPATSDEYLAITRDLLVALGRVQSWIDALVPWAKLDRALAPEALAAVHAGTLVEEPRS